MKLNSMFKNKLILYVSFFLVGCSQITSLYPAYSDKITSGQAQWFNPDTGNNPSFELYTSCYHEGRENVIRKYSLSKNDGLYDFRYDIGLHQGHCLYKKGFLFYPKLFSNYCQHDFNKEECRAYEKYRKIKEK